LALGAFSSICSVDIYDELLRCLPNGSRQSHSFTDTATESSAHAFRQTTMNCRKFHTQPTVVCLIINEAFS
jgi:hypothetical protein